MVNGTINATKLNAPDLMALNMAVAGTQTGLLRFYVAFTYDKQTKAKPRVAGQDFLALPGGATRKLHMGWLYAAPVNKKGSVYLLIADVARADGNKHFAWTAVRPDGLRDFQIRGIAQVIAPQTTQSVGAPTGQGDEE